MSFVSLKKVNKAWDYVYKKLNREERRELFNRLQVELGEDGKF